MRISGLYVRTVDLSVVIAVRNEERHLPEQLEALAAQVWDGQWEVLVIDNGSTDGTSRVARDWSHRIANLRIVDASDRADKSYALNVGVTAARAERLAFCDGDDVVCPGWVAAMATALATFDVVTGPNELDRLNEPWLAESRGRSIESPVGSFAGIFPSIRGNNWGVQRAIWDRLGGMNEAFHLEDLELSMRCWAAGINVVGVPEAVVHYRYRPDAGALWRQGFAYGSHRPLIARELRRHALPTPPRFGGWRSWLLLVVRLPTVVSRSGRARWLWIAGNRWGQVVGSIRYRTLML